MADFKEKRKLGEGSSGWVAVCSLSEGGEEFDFALKRAKGGADDFDAKMVSHEVTFGEAAKKWTIKRKQRDVICGASGRTLGLHDNIAYFFGDVEDAKTPVKRALAFEVCDGDMKHLIREQVSSDCAFFDESDLLIVASDLLCVLFDIHEAGFAHCDVGLGNILYVIRDGMIRLKLTDFGLAQRCKDGDPEFEVVKDFLLDTAPEAIGHAAMPATAAPAMDAW